MTRTVVLGTSAAGTVAARALHDAGEDVALVAALVEALDRPGGRAWSAPPTLRFSPVIPAQAGMTQ